MKNRFAIRQKKRNAHPEGFGCGVPYTTTGSNNPASRRVWMPFQVPGAVRRCCADACACARLTDCQRTKSAAPNLH